MLRFRLEIGKGSNSREDKRMDKREELNKKIEKKGGVISRVSYRKVDEEKRSIVVKMYTTQEEKKQLELKAKRVGKELSVYCREVCLEQRMIATKDSQRWGILGKLGSQFIEFKNEVKGEEVNHPGMVQVLDKILNEIKLLREDLLK
jgi:plasmid stability protein